jgi:hypothetical protein
MTLGYCDECNCTGRIHELDGRRVRMIPHARYGDVVKKPCPECKVSEAEWIDINKRIQTADQIAAAHRPLKEADKDGNNA